MNAKNHNESDAVAPSTTPVAETARVVPFAPTRRYRERAIGTGYGSSSGYGLDKRYTSDWGSLRFRCA